MRFLYMHGKFMCLCVHVLCCVCARAFVFMYKCVNFARVCFVHV